ncbi:hypothetical protein ACWKT5_14340 [Streptomyces avermitilis]
MPHAEQQRPLTAVSAPTHGHAYAYAYAYGLSLLIACHTVPLAAGSSPSP